MKNFIKRKRLWLTAGLLLLLLLAIALDNRLKIQHYTVEAAAISQPVRLCLLTDLHSCRYGENEQQLVEAINAEQPDILLLVGDIFDDQIADDKIGRAHV